MTNVDVEHKVGDVDDQRLGEELRPCQHYLEDSELERARQKVFSYAVETLNESLVNKELLQQFKKSSKIEFGSWFHFEKKDGGFRYFYAHENHTLLDRSKLVCSRDDLAKPKDSCFLPIFRYHIILSGDFRELLQKLDAFSFKFQHVDCLYTPFKYRFSGKSVAKIGKLFDFMQRAVYFRHQNRGVDRMPSIAKKRLLGEKLQETFLELPPKD